MWKTWNIPMNHTCDQIIFISGRWFLSCSFSPYWIFEMAAWGNICKPVPAISFIIGFIIAGSCSEEGFPICIQCADKSVHSKSCSVRSVPFWNTGILKDFKLFNADVLSEQNETIWPLMFLCVINLWGSAPQCFCFHTHTSIMRLVATLFS